MDFGAASNFITGNNIEANGADGVHIDGVGTNANEITDNIIGSTANPNGGDGVHIHIRAKGNPVSENIIRNNMGHGIRIEDELTDGNIITANQILDNALSGVHIAQGAGTSPPAVNFIGGTVPQASNLISGNMIDGVTILAGTDNTIMGNTILFNGVNGVRVVVGIRNSIRRNSIASNVAGLGIDLGTDGIVTINDVGDGDFGANLLQNYPILNFVTSRATSTTIQGTLNSLANTTFTLEFFANRRCDGSDFGEGETFIGSAEVTTDGNGDASFNVVLPTGVPDGQLITATATDDVGDPLFVLANTSEFSECITVPTPPPLRTADISGPLGPGFPDGCVDAFDLGTLLGAWCSAAGDPDPPKDEDPPCEGCTSPNFTLADISGSGNVPDGCVDAFDLAKLLAEWCSVAGGNPCGTCFPPP